MKNQKLNLDEFAGSELSKEKKLKVIGGDFSPPPPLIDEDGNPVNPTTGTNNGDIKPGVTEIKIFVFEP